MQVGDLLHASSLTLSGLIGGSNFSTTVRAKKGTGVLLLVLGEEMLDGSGEPVDIEATLAEMGWVPTPERRRILDEEKVKKVKKGATK